MTSGHWRYAIPKAQDQKRNNAFGKWHMMAPALAAQNDLSVRHAADGPGRPGWRITAARGAVLLRPRASLSVTLSSRKRRVRFRDGPLPPACWTPPSTTAGDFVRCSARPWTATSCSTWRAVSGMTGCWRGRDDDDSAHNRDRGGALPQPLGSCAAAGCWARAGVTLKPLPGAGLALSLIGHVGCAKIRKFCEQGSGI